MKRTSRQIHTFVAVGITAAFVLVTCAACSKENKAVPAMATVSSGSVSSDIGLGTLMDSMVSSTASAASSSASSIVANSSSSSSSTAKPSGGTTVKPSGGTTKPSGGSTGTDGSTTKPSGGSTDGGTVTPTPPTPPASTGINAQYHGAKYGCTSQSQYDYVMGKANAITSSSKYASNYAFNKEEPDVFKTAMGVDYSDEMNKVISIRGCFSGSGKASSGSAYDYFTGANRSCADTSNALEAALHINGINARLAWGTWNGEKHMWVQAYVNGAWYNLVGKPSTSLQSAGLVLWGSGYNY